MKNMRYHPMNIGEFSIEFTFLWSSLSSLDGGCRGHWAVILCSGPFICINSARSITEQQQQLNILLTSLGASLDPLNVIVAKKSNMAVSPPL